MDIRFGTNLERSHSQTKSAMENEDIFFFKVSGTVHRGKQPEFQQTVHFIFDHLPDACISWNLALDVLQPNLYHLYCLWRSRKALVAFRSGNEFQLLKNSFENVGSYRETVGGIRAHMDFFEIHDVFEVSYYDGGRSTTRTGFHPL